MTKRSVTPATMATIAPGLGFELDARRTRVEEEGVDLATSVIRAAASERGRLGIGVEDVAGGNGEPSCGGVVTGSVGAPDDEDACRWGMGTDRSGFQVAGSTCGAFGSAGIAL